VRAISPIRTTTGRMASRSVGGLGSLDGLTAR
jgi:hypothetical protein